MKAVQMGVLPIRQTYRELDGNRKGSRRVLQNKEVVEWDGQIDD